MSSRFAQGAAALASMALLSFVLISCASEPATNGDTPVEEVADQVEADATKSGDEDYAFGAERDDMATAIEAAFSGKNPSARWDGDQLILALDGDINAAAAGFTECRVLNEILLETDTASIEFPNGTITCEEVLAE